MGLFLLWAGAVALGLGGGALVALATAGLPRPHVTAVVVLTIVHVAWVIVPLLAASVDATLDAQSFELLPLRPVELGLGLLVSGVAGPGGFLTVLFVGIGLGFGLWPGWAGLLAVPALTVLATVIVVVSGRLVTTLGSSALRTSKAQGIGQVAGAVVGVAAVLATGVAWDVVELVENGLPEQMIWLAILPSGAAGAAFGSLEAGSYAPAVGFVAWAVVGAAFLSWLYGRALARSQTTPSSGRPVRVSTEEGLFGERLRGILRSDPVRASAAKELRYLRRDPRLRAQLIGGLTAVGVIVVVSASLLDTSYAAFVSVVVTWGMIASVASNQFGVDAGSFWAYVVTPADPSAALLGKNASWAVVTVPIAAMSAAFGSWLSSDWTFLAAALLASGTTLLIWMGVGNITSVYGAFPFPERQLFGSNPGGRALLVSMAGLAVSGVLSGPPVAAVVAGAWLGGPTMATFAALGGLVYGAVLYRFTRQWARTLVSERRFVLIEALDQS